MKIEHPAGVQEVVEALVRRLKWRYPREARLFTDDQMTEMVSEAVASCPAIEIVSEEDVFRFVALRVLLTQEQRQSCLVQGVLVRILSHLDWSSSKRLDFVYKHVVGRPVASKETDFGSSFTAVVKGP